MISTLKDVNYESREDLVFNRQPPFIYTHLTLEAEFRLYQKNRSPEEIALAKTKSACKALIIKVQQGDARKQAAKRKRDDEKARKFSLSLEERKAEAAVIKAAKLLKTNNAQRVKRELLAHAEADLIDLDGDDDQRIMEVLNARLGLTTSAARVDVADEHDQDSNGEGESSGDEE